MRRAGTTLLCAICCAPFGVRAASSSSLSPSRSGAAGPPAPQRGGGRRQQQQHVRLTGEPRDNAALSVSPLRRGLLVLNRHPRLLAMTLIAMSFCLSSAGVRGSPLPMPPPTRSDTDRSSGNGSRNANNGVGNGNGHRVPLEEQIPVPQLPLHFPSKAPLFGKKIPKLPGIRLPPIKTGLLVPRVRRRRKKKIWHSIDKHRQMIASAIAETVKAEKTPDLQAQGPVHFRGLRFWSRAVVIYFSYKKAQAYCTFALPVVVPATERETVERSLWQRVHALNSDRMLDLCLKLRGFYLKSGQFLGTRHDFMPKVYLQKLGLLHDAVPPMPADQVRRVVEAELGGPIEDVLTGFNITHPVGSASISQVHVGYLKETGEKVAVKVQYPGAESVMLGDLGNLKVLAGFLQRFELNFDIVSSLRELSRQIRFEFDFTHEAAVMNRMWTSLRQHNPLITLPQSRLASRKLLIMSFIEGQSLASIKRAERERFRSLRRRIGQKLLSTLADSWGYMIFEEGLFNADLHPGNILIMPEGRSWGPTGLLLGLLGVRTPKLRVGLLDWGQIKELDFDSRVRFAHMIEAISKGTPEEVVNSFLELGVKLADPDDSDSIEKLARVMFDTKVIPGLNFNPFSEGNVLKLNSVIEYPQDMYFVLRAILMFRGMARSLKLDFSIADEWAPFARKLLAQGP
jgi:aarF domain-containing kinase